MKYFLLKLILIFGMYETYSQSNERYPIHIGIGYSFTGNMKFEDPNLQLWKDDIRGINGNLQWKDAFSSSLDFNFLKPKEPNPMYNFKHYFDVKFGMGTILLRKKRLNFPIYLNLGYTHLILEEAVKNQGSILVGYNVGLNFFLSNKTYLYLSYTNSISGLEMIEFKNSSKVKDFTFNANFLTVGVGSSLFVRESSRIKNNY